MDQTTILAFLASFVLGPAICAALLRLPRRIWALLALATAVVVATVAALRLQASGTHAVLGLTCLWLGWVLAMAMLGLALLRRFAGNRARRWITVLTLLATTLPWFGLATAQMMV